MLSMCQPETEDLTYEPHINVLKEELILELRSHQLRDTAVARIFSALASGQLVLNLAAWQNSLANLLAPGTFIFVLTIIIASEPFRKPCGHIS